MYKLSIATLAAGLAAVAAPQAAPKSTGVAPRPTVEFIENKGQWDPHVRFLGRSPGIDMWITDSGVTYSYYRTTKEDKPKWNGHIVRIGFVGAGKQVKTLVSGSQRKPYTYNFFLSNDRSKWRSHVPVYSSVHVKDLYKGVDLVAYFDPIKQRPRYDLVVKPGVDASKIAMAYRGAEGLHITGKGLVAYNTNLGKIEERDLFVYQPKTGLDVDFARPKIARHDKSALTAVNPVRARMAMANDGTVRFALGARDANRTTVIDPIVWASYLEGNNSDAMNTAVVGPDGSTYMVGLTASSDYPQTAGAALGPAISGVFLSRLSPDGKSLMYSTVFGGGTFYGIAVQSDGSVVIGGNAYPGFPTTPGAYMSSYPGYGGPVGIVTKLSPDGGTLQYSSYLGQPADIYSTTGVRAVAVDSDGSVYAVGNGNAIGVSTDGGANHSYTSGSAGFCVKFTPDGSALSYGALIPGGNPMAVTVDSDHKAYVCGLTVGGIPTTSGAFQTSRPGFLNGFVTKINADGSAFDYATYLGGTGSGGDWATTIAVNAAGCAYVGGRTTSTDFPITPGVYRPSFPAQAGGDTGFITKLSADGASLAFSTFFGNRYSTQIKSLSVDVQGLVYFTGSSWAGPNGTSSVATTPGAYQYSSPSFNSAFVGLLAYNGAGVGYVSYIGGSDSEQPVGAGLAPDGSYIVAGQTSSIDFPTTIDSFQPLPTNPSGSFVAKVDLRTDATLGFTPANSSGGTIMGAVYVPTAPATDTVVALTPASSLVRVPATVTIPAGQRSASFPVTVRGVDTTTLVDVRAALPSGSVKRFVRINPAYPFSLVVSTSEVVAGSSAVKVTVNLNGPAGPSGVDVRLDTSDASLVSVPSTLHFGSGKASLSFTAGIAQVTSQSVCTINLYDKDCNFVTSADLTLDPYAVSGLTLSPTTLYGGFASVGKITLNAAAPTGGCPVDLTSADSTNVTIPTQVVVPAGAKTASFDLTTIAGYTGTSEKVVITGTVGGSSKVANLTLRPVLMTGFSVTPTALRSGYPTTATISVNTLAPAGGVPARLTSSNPAAITVPSSVTIPAGAQLLNVPLQVNPNFAGPDGDVTITVTCQGATKTQVVSVKKLNLVGFIVSPTAVKGGTTAYVTLTLDALTQSAVSVALTSSSSAVSATTLVIPAGVQSVTLPVTTHAVATNATVTLTATQGATSKTTTLTVKH